VASQSTFGIIAREMRKYNVTLLVVDQRPSGIDPEVMSQIATKVCCLLDDDRDVDAVMTGTSGSRELRSVLAGLESRQQALIFGNAVPIPVAVRIRDYGTADSYDTLMRSPGTRKPAGKAVTKEPAAAGRKDDEDELFG
jgi:DNA helicase HerA-like ATPase